MGGFTLLNTSPKVCVTDGEMQATLHLTMYIFAKRERTALTMAPARPPWPSRMIVKKPPISGFARFCMNSMEFCLNSSYVLAGYHTLMTGTGSFGRAVLSSGKRPPVM